MNYKIVKYREGCSIKGYQAQEVAQEIERIREEKGGTFSPADVVEEARPADSKLHNAGFTWNVKKAAQAHWEDQARRLMTCYEVITYNDSDEVVDRENPVHVSVANPFKPGKAYMQAIEAMKNPATRERVLEHEIRQFEGWVQRNKHIKELAEYAIQAEALAKKMRADRNKKRRRPPGDELDRRPRP